MLVAVRVDMLVQLRTEQERTMTADATSFDETNPSTSDEQELTDVQQALEALDAGDEGVPLNEAFEHVRRNHRRV